MTSACEKQLVSALTVLTVLQKNGHRRCFVILVPKGIVSIGSRDIPSLAAAWLYKRLKTIQWYIIVGDQQIWLHHSV